MHDKVSFMSKRTKRDARIQKMIDEMVAEAVDAETDGGAREFIDSILRTGCVGFDNMTDEEVEKEYNELRLEDWSDEIDWMAKEWDVAVAEMGEKKARKRFVELRDNLLKADKDVADVYPDGKPIR